MCYTYHHLYQIDVTVVRYFTVFGPAGRPDMSLFRFVQRIREGRPITVFGDGSQQRDFTYVDDIARGTIAALRPLGFAVINLGSDHPVVLNDVIALIEKLVGKKAQIERRPMHPADIHSTWADISRAREILEWQPQVPFEEGVRRLVEWYEKEREWAAQVPTE
jgi:nucleoside-diphosphate-sugar epimerase